MTNPSLYVGTYAKYNSGSIAGAWVDLTDFVDSEGFYEHIRELHKDETDPEFMFQDFEGFPKSLYSESGGVGEIYEYIDFCEATYLDKEAVDAGLSLDIPLDKIEEAYVGEYDSDEDFAQEQAESFGGLSDTWPYTRTDWKWAARVLMMDYAKMDGYYFSNNW